MFFFILTLYTRGVQILFQDFLLKEIKINKKYWHLKKCVDKRKIHLNYIKKQSIKIDYYYPL